MRTLRTVLVLLLVFSVARLAAAEPAPVFSNGVDKDKATTESPLRRGEIIFMVSYPFTFLASAASYGIFSYGVAAIDGKSSFALDGTFYAVSALTAAILSFGIAIDDYYTIKAQTKSVAGNPVGYLSLSYRF